MLHKFIQRASQTAVAWGFLGVALRLASIVLVLPLMLRKISPEELGLWYVFGALGGLAGMLDFGFDPTMTRTAGYAWSGAKDIKPLGVSHAEDSHASGPNFELLERIVSNARAFYRTLALVTGALLLTAGSWWIWQKTAGLEHQTSLRCAWLVSVLAGSINAWSNLWPALLSGINGVRESQKIVAVSLLVNTILTLAGLLVGLGLWALVLSQLAMGCLVRQWGKAAFTKISGGRIGRLPGRFDSDLFKNMLPMCWRSGLLALGSYLSLSANTLVCSAYLGLKETASYGLTLQVVSALMSISSVWVGVKYPLLNLLRAQKKSGEIALIFISRMRLVIMTYVIGSIFAMFYGNDLLHFFGSKTPLVSPSILLLTLAAYLLTLHQSQYATLILTENHMPFLWPALISGAAVVATSFLLTPYLGLLGLILSFAIVQSCFNNWYPVFRGIKGLGMTNKKYWILFFSARKSLN